jgi:hypothetical protein
MAADPNDEAKWRAEFEQFGEESVRDSLHDGLFPEPKRQFAYRWLEAEAQKRLRREERSFLYLKLTLAAAILGVIVGIVGIVVTANACRLVGGAKHVSAGDQQLSCLAATRRDIAKLPDLQQKRKKNSGGLSNRRRSPRGSAEIDPESLRVDGFVSISDSHARAESILILLLHFWINDFAGTAVLRRGELR